MGEREQVTSDERVIERTAAGAAEPPSASREQQLLTELAYWKARCGVMHGDETNAVTKSVTVPVLPTSEEDERIVDAAIKRRLSGETEAPLTFETFFAKVRETGWNPSPRELATLLYEYEKEHCICSEFQGVNLRCPIHGTAESETERL